MWLDAPFSPSLRLCTVSILTEYLFFVFQIRYRAAQIEGAKISVDKVADLEVFMQPPLLPLAITRSSKITSHHHRAAVVFPLSHEDLYIDKNKFNKMPSALHSFMCMFGSTLEVMLLADRCHF
jgi:hypothetical protein